MPVGDRMVGLVACMAVAALTSGHYAFSVFSGVRFLTHLRPVARTI